MNVELYKTYSTDDFILDEDFQKIVQVETDGQLQELIEGLPEKKNEINLAAQILRGMYAGKFQQDEHKKQEFWQKIIRKQKKKVRLQYFRYAASILVLVGIGGGIFYISAPKTEEVVVATETPSDNAILVLADGKTVSISSKQSTVQYSSDGSGIMVNDTAGVAQPVSSEGLNQLIVPFGKRSFITLSEGTKVWLNSGSKLIFPPVFKGKVREVILMGEALFDVAKNEKKPFLVKTDAFSLKVYGTKFNVQAYQQDKNYNIVLVEGKVGMSTDEKHSTGEVFLEPNQKASISKGDESFEITHIENIEVYTAWVDGYLTFTNEDISDLLKRVSRYYNVDIDVDLTKDQGKIYGKLDLKEDLERVLDGIAFISKTKYEKREDRYVFINN
jgi:ferric-dicitrate binding protein FerR (iron transport regulator)